MPLKTQLNYVNLYKGIFTGDIKINIHIIIVLYVPIVISEMICVQLASLLCSFVRVSIMRMHNCNHMCSPFTRIQNRP